MTSSSSPGSIARGDRVLVRGLEAVDGTPIIDVKPVLTTDIGER
jgi:tRNA (Thr-GGU) A37 N-methylase